MQRANAKALAGSAAAYATANANALAADATSYAMGQHEGTGSFCSCIWNGPVRRHQQQLQAVYSKGQCECIGRCCICVCNGPTQRHRQQQQLHMQWANANASAAAAAENSMGPLVNYGRFYSVGPFINYVIFYLIGPCGLSQSYGTKCMWDFMRTTAECASWAHSLIVYQVSQRLSKWRGSFGSAAIAVVNGFFNGTDKYRDLNNMRQEFASHMLDKLRFVFRYAKGDDPKVHVYCFIICNTLLSMIFAEIQWPLSQSSCCTDFRCSLTCNFGFEIS
jgi:hypothetical protein